MEMIDQDSRPIYLGYQEDHKKYWFYMLKDKVPRFLTYVTYWCWDAPMRYESGAKNVLVFVPVPEEVEKELEEFLTGKIEYEFVKRRKNSSSIRVTKVYRNPCEVGSSEKKERGSINEDHRVEEPLKSISAGVSGRKRSVKLDPVPAGEVPRPDAPRSGREKPRCIIPLPTPEKTKEMLEVKQKRKRRTKAEMLAAREASLPKEAAPKKVVENVGGEAQIEKPAKRKYTKRPKE